MKVNQGVSIVTFIFIVISLISIGVMVFLAFRLSWIKNEMVEVESTIISISRFDNDNHLVMIEYVYDNIVYIDRYHIYSSTMQEGDIINIYVDPNFPEINYQPDIFFYFVFPGIFALVFGGIGFAGLFSWIRKKQLKTKYMTSGKKVVATIVDMKTNYQIRMTTGRHHSYRSHFICKVTDEYLGTEQVFKSRSFWLPSGHGIQTGISKVDVYIDINDKNNYFVDIDSISTQPFDAFHPSNLTI
jgi:hypothetical protein